LREIADGLLHGQILRSDARKFKRLMSSDDPWSSIKNLNEPDDLDLPPDSYWE